MEADIRDVGLTPGLGRSPGGGHGNPLQYSCLENPMNRGAWWGIVHRVAKNQAQLKWLSTHTQKEREYIISVLLGSNANHYTLNYVGKWYVCCCWRVWEWRCRRSWRQHKWKLLCLTCSAHPTCEKESVFCSLWGGLAHSAWQHSKSWGIKLFISKVTKVLWEGDGDLKIKDEGNTN